MAELTNEQVDKALKACEGKFLGKGIRAAAPFLQLPWDEPSEDEAKVIHSTNLGMSLTATFDQCKWNVLREFVDRRNAALMPKPVDPRIGLIDRTLCDFMHSLNNIEERTKAAKAILAALLDWER